MAWLFLATSAWVTSAEPDLKAVYPSACPHGASVEVTLIGSGLDTGASLHFSRPGLAAEQIDKARFRVTANVESPPGDCDVWVATADGLAGPKRFSVTRHRVFTEFETNDTVGDAQAIEFPSVVAGQLDKAADLDWFAFKAQRDQMATIICQSQSLDGSVQPFFTLLAPSGRELSHSPSRSHEPRIVILLPETGVYRVLVHDRAYRKDDASFYRLTILAGLVDTDSRPRIISPEELFEIAISKDSGTRSYDEPQLVELPCRLAGRFARRGQVDWFRLTAKKDQTIHLEAFGERLAQLMDLDVTICDSKGKPIVALKDSATPKGIPATLPLASLDPSIDWKVPADGEYSVAVRDLYGGSIFGSDRHYQLVAQLQQPSFFVVALYGSDKPCRGIFVKQGADTEVTLIVVRSGGFAEPVTILSQDLPSGLLIEPTTVAAQEVTKKLKLSVAPDAPLGFHPLRLVAEAEIGSDKRTVAAYAATVIRVGVTRRVDSGVIFVSE